MTFNPMKKETAKVTLSTEVRNNECLCTRLVNLDKYFIIVWKE